MEPTLQEQLSNVLSGANLRAGARALADQGNDDYAAQLNRAADILWEIVETEDDDE